MQLIAALAAGLALMPAAQADTAKPIGDGARTAAAIRGETIRAHLGFLADDLLEGRAPATRGGELAAKYIATQFRRLGLQPVRGGTAYLHPIPIARLTPHPFLRVLGENLTTFRPGHDFLLRSLWDDSSVAVQGEAVFVGYGIVARSYGWDDYRGADVRGKIVVVLPRTPVVDGKPLFPGRAGAEYANTARKVREAAARGAAGVLFVHVGASAPFPWERLSVSMSREQGGLVRPRSSTAFMGWIRDSAAAALLAPGTAMDVAARLGALEAIASSPTFHAIPLGRQVEARIRSAVRRQDSHNIVARLPGRGPRASEVVLIGAHYDHLGIGEPVGGDSIYNGAQDNASGTAGLLALAEAMISSRVRPERSVVFVAFGAEEPGLYGSQAFVDRPPVPLETIVAMLNMDGLNLMGPTRDILALGLGESTLGGLYRAAAEAEGLRVPGTGEAIIQELMRQDAFQRSDQFPFALGGIPSLFLWSGYDYMGREPGWGRARQSEFVTERYHRPDDELSPGHRMDGAAQQLRVAARLILDIANAPDRPRWAETSAFQPFSSWRLP